MIDPLHVGLIAIAVIATGAAVYRDRRAARWHEKYLEEHGAKWELIERYDRRIDEIISLREENRRLSKILERRPTPAAVDAAMAEWSGR